MEASDIPPTNEELLTECDVQVFRARGHGGQSVNTADSAVRLIHRPTGVAVVCRRERSQLLNKRACLARLRARLEALAAVPAERLPTEVPQSEREERLRDKSVRGRAKRLRTRVEPEEE